MEAVIIARNHCCRELFPIMYTTDLLSEAVGLLIGYTEINVPIHEDNDGTLVLTETITYQFTPKSKHCTSKNIWFLEEI